MSGEREFYVISVHHTQRWHQYITVWRPDNKGYAWPLSWAGRYPESVVAAHPDYYHSGFSNVVVPCEALDAVAVPPAPNTVDNDAGPVVLNNRANWQRILKALPWVPPHEPKPEYRGARHRRNR